MTNEPLCWYKSSYSSNGGDCIEAAFNLVATTGIVPVRDSKQGGGPVVTVSADTFASFVRWAGARDGEFGDV
ncbi:MULTISPECIES: DUF397 domain-containing protein [unclassified Streptomyces]|uniref:DUF397 domain-containing protein n=1 Tax=unclassified Streptomyces TaxID=2593676 RepID=UPI000DAE3099|nr:MULTISPECIES: DUF397 domain-containing protein [unclassified Streptomyces]PZT71947.1 DUF397 domain-containing protein [Streptomyces sp. AC1-42T]PZT81727.1 DUF397 domain-containing protein [Streptomyces sp. AC1-42W]